MKRSFSIGLTAALVVLSFLPRAHAGYSKAHASITNLRLIGGNISWEGASYYDVLPVYWAPYDLDFDGRLYAMGGAMSHASAVKPLNQDDVSQIASWSDPTLNTSVAAGWPNAKADASTYTPTASLLANAYAEESGPSASTWGAGTAVLTEAFKAESSGNVTIEVDFSLSYNMDISSGFAGNVRADALLQFWKKGIFGWQADYLSQDLQWLVESKDGVWAGPGAASGTLAMTAYYYEGEIGGLLRAVNAKASYGVPCGPTVPAPIAVMLASVGVVTVVVLRRRRVI